MTEQQFTPTQHLKIEVLAVRYRLGEQLWNFPTRPALVRAAKQLEDRGLIWIMGGNVERTFRAGLTDEGKELGLSKTYVAPVAVGGTQLAAAQVEGDLSSAVGKLRQLERIVSTADWQSRAQTPQLFHNLLADILQVIDIDSLDGFPPPYEYPDDENAREHAEYTRQKYSLADFYSSPGTYRDVDGHVKPL